MEPIKMSEESDSTMDKSRLSSAQTTGRPEKRKICSSATDEDSSSEGLTVMIKKRKYVSEPIKPTSVPVKVLSPQSLREKKDVGGSGHLEKLVNPAKKRSSSPEDELSSRSTKRFRKAGDGDASETEHTHATSKTDIPDKKELT